jgi:hypothetical protein
LTESVLQCGGELPHAGAAIAPTYATIYAMVEDAAPSGSLTEAFAWLATAAAIGSAAGAAIAGALADGAGALRVPSEAERPSVSPCGMSMDVRRSDRRPCPRGTAPRGVPSHGGRVWTGPATSQDQSTHVPDLVWHVLDCKT